MVNTSYFPIGQLVATLGINMLAWVFVNVVTLERTDPFSSGNGGHLDFHRMLMIVVIVFFYSTINT